MTAESLPSTFVAALADSSYTAFRSIEDGQVLKAGGIELHAIATPGHSPGSTCLYAPDLGAVFSGDTLFQGGPGATGRSFSDFPTILGSIKDKLGKLPADTVVYTGHGDTTKIGDEIVHYDDGAVWRSSSRPCWRCAAPGRRAPRRRAPRRRESGHRERR